jgi:hypothetical protein
MLGILIAIKGAEYARKAKKFADPNGPHADLVDSAKTKFGQCRDGVAQCLNGAGKFIDEQTDGKYSETINSGVGKATNLIGADSSDSADKAGPEASPGASPVPEDSAQSRDSDSTQPESSQPSPGGSSPERPPQA